MELYKIGKIVSVGKAHIILESNYTGYTLYVARPNQWDEFKDAVRKVYVFNFKSEYTTALYGFSTFSERVLFEDLIGVSGVGPRTALNILREGEQLAIDLIARGDAEKLTQLPQVGLKSANQIVFELKAKYERYAARATETKRFLPLDIKPSLKSLGFTPKQIDYAVEHLEPETTVELMVEKAIKLISNAKLS